MDVEVRVLGRTRASADGSELNLGGRKPAEVLTLLAAARGRPVGAAVLADRLWRGVPPLTATTTLQGHVARLRRVLEPDRTRPQLLVTVGDAYALRGVTVDAARAEQQVREGLALLRQGSPTAAATALAGALDLWEGDALELVRDVAEVAPEAARLDQLRLTAQDAHAAALLESGTGTELVPDLARHAGAHPLREETQALLARALYRSGRQAEALEVLDQLRRRLLDELGVDPSREVRELHQALLRQDSALDARPRAATSAAAVELRDASTGRGGGTAESPAAPEGAAEPGAVGGFVGRDGELSSLRQAWERAATGRTTAVAVTGESGIGKTRLVEVAADRLGVVPRWGRSQQTGGSPPYWPWQQLLGGLPRPASEEEGPAARWAFGMEVVDRLRAMAAGGPQLLVLDDLQWADADSLHVLEMVLAELRDSPLLLVVTCRTDAEAASPVLAHLARTPGARRLVLGGLAAADVARLVAEQAGARLDDAQVAALVTRTGGNPFFVTELATLGDEGLSTLPDGVRDVVRLRLAGLPAAARTVLEVLAVAARELPVAIVAAASNTPLVGLQKPLQAALTAAVVVEPSPGRLRLTHDLVRDTLVADLGPARRAVVHAALADALSAGAASATSAAAIALHRSEAALGGPDAAAAHSCLAAAEESLARASDEEAIALARRGQTHATAEQREVVADFQHVVGVAARRLGRLEESRAALAREAAWARHSGDTARLARAAVAAAGGGIGGYWTTFAAPFTTDVGLLEEAAAGAERLDPDQRSRVLAALAVHRSARGEPGAPELAERAATVAGTGGSPSALRRAHVAQFVATWTPATAAERVEIAQQLLRSAGGSAATEATALHLLRTALLEDGRLGESAAVSRQLDAVVQGRHDADLRLLQTWWQVGQHLMRGEHESARRLADTASGDTPSVSPAAAGLAQSSRSTVEGIAAWHEGRLVDILPAAVDLAATVEPEWLVIQALGHAEAGNHEQARAAVHRLRRVPSAGARQPVRTVLLAEVYVALADTAGCAELLGVLETYGDTVVVLWPGVVTLGPSALYRGSVLAVLGETGRARTELERALVLAEELGAAPYAARARRRLAALPAV